MNQRNKTESESLYYWGIDGCTGGWLCVGLDDANGVCSFVACDIACAYEKIKNHGGRKIFIDMPIGLPCDERPRCCDVMARTLVGDRRSSVFSTPSRQAINTFVKVLRKTMNLHKAGCAAKEKNKETTGKSLSNQSLGIVLKIYEVDEFLRLCSGAKEIVHEVHPEVCFRMLAGEPLKYSKRNKDGSGHTERKKILSGYLSQYTEIGYIEIYKKIREHPSGKVKDDDIHDALVAALTAKLYEHKDFETEPPLGNHQKDRRRELPMEMVYVKRLP